MNQAYQKIHSHLNQLLSEKVKIDQKMKDIDKTDAKLKSEMHRTEIDLLSLGTQTNAINHTNRLYHDVNILRHDRQALHKDKQNLKSLMSAAQDLDKKITATKFWLKQATYDDSTKQAEALKRVFG